MTEPLKIGVLLSGSGTNLQAIIDAAAEGLPVEIVHVVSSRPDAFGIERAHRAGIPVTVLNRDVYADPVEADKRIAETLCCAHAEYVVMAGYMRKVTPVLLDAFPDRVLNEDYDKGPIVAQRAVEVREDDTHDDLEARIHEVEHVLYPEVLRLVAEGRVTVGEDRKVHIAPAR